VLTETSQIQAVDVRSRGSIDVLMLSNGQLLWAQSAAASANLVTARSAAE
jgi:hypothetical protein